MIIINNKSLYKSFKRKSKNIYFQKIKLIIHFENKSEKKVT